MFFLDRTKHETIFLKEKKQFSFSFDKKVKNLLRTKLILGHKSWTISVQGFEKKNCLFVLVGQNQNRTPIRWLKVQSLGLKFLGKVIFLAQVNQGFIFFMTWSPGGAPVAWFRLGVRNRGGQDFGQCPDQNLKSVTSVNLRTRKRSGKKLAPRRKMTELIIW